MINKTELLLFPFNELHQRSPNLRTNHTKSDKISLKQKRLQETSGPQEKLNAFQLRQLVLSQKHHLVCYTDLLLLLFQHERIHVRYI